MKKMQIIVVAVLSVMLMGCGKEKTDIDVLEGIWTNEDGWSIEFFEPTDEESGDIEITNWNDYEGVRLGSYECHESSKRLTIQYPDNWNVEILEDTYTYEFVDDDTLMLYPDGEADEGVEYSRTE